MVMAATVERQISLEQSLGTVGEAMTREVVLLAADMTAEAALHRLDETAVSGAPVVDRGRVVGVVTRRDLMVPTLLDDPSGFAALAPERRRDRLIALRVSELMSDEAVTSRPDRPLVEAVRSMIGAGVNRLPVVDPAGRPLGVLTRDDVLRALARPAPEAKEAAGGPER
jgi:CBS domain-containing protein